MARHGGFHGDLRRLFIPDFSDHHHVGVLTQKSAKRRGKVKADFLVDVHLDDSRQVVFDRVLSGEDLHVGSINGIQRRIQRRGFSRTGRSAYED